MIKIAQHTRLDEKMQKTPGAYQREPEQKLLFPEKDKEYHHLKEFETIPKAPLQPLNLEYPELKEDDIGTRSMNPTEEARVRNEIGYYTENASKHPYTTPQYEAEAKVLKQYFKDNEIQDVLKGKVLAKYDQLRTKSIEFYAAYQEANKLAVLEYVVNTSGTYEDLFKDFPKLVINEITKGIGILFGTEADEKVMGTLQKGINIFTVHSLSYQRQMDSMDKFIKAMDTILADYNHRRKLLKGLVKNIGADVETFLAEPYWQTFLTWMDEYFPHHKEQFVEEAVSRIQQGHSSATNDFYALRLGDLIKFKTFKSIYEKANTASGLGLKKMMTGSAEEKLKEELEAQIGQRIVMRGNALHSFLESLEPSLTPEEQLNSFISFTRKKFNIDLRALISFSQGVNKKRNENYKQEVVNTPAAIDDEKLAHLNNDFYVRCLAELKKAINNIENTGNGGKNYFLDNSVNSYVRTMGAKKFDHFISMEGMQKALVLNAKDFDAMANNFVYDHIVSALPGFSRNTDIFGNSDKFPTFGGIREILQATEGKFSIEAFTNHAHQYVPFIPKELIFSYVRSLFKDLNNRGLNRLDLLKGTNYQNAAKVLFNVLKNNGKLEHNSFTKLFLMLPHFGDTFSRIRSDMPKSLTDENVVFIMTNTVRNLTTIESDLKNLEAFTTFLHNETGNLNDAVITKIVSNKNFINFTKVGIVRKLFKAYAQIQNLGGVEKIYADYNDIIEDLTARDFIGKDFKENMGKIQHFFESNNEISPKSKEFTDLFESASKMESDLATLQMGDALKEMIRDYIPKDPKVFALDLPINDKIRFRVLRDKDPRIMRIGIETDCCQRIGGVGEAAARDSFINPLSSILVLEWKNPEDPSEWLILSQSYFHYVPAENGYILDNVENNSRNVSRFKTTESLSLDEVYALFAEEIKNKLNVSYLLSGKGYSKIEPSRFKTNKRPKDPRSFDNRALTPKHQEHYSDFDENNSINLLSPKFNLANVKSKVSRAHEKMRGMIKAILNPSTFFKTAQQTEDVKSIQGVKVSLFGPQSWIYINQFMNELNAGLISLAGTQKLGEQTINFQTVVKNPTGQTRFTGGMKSLFDLSTRLWGIITANKTTVYSVDEAKGIVDNLLHALESAEFPEPSAQSIKPKLTSILNSWLAILK
jgi:hypothetical protein